MVAGNDGELLALHQAVRCENLSSQIVIIRVAGADNVARDDKMVTTVFKNCAKEDLERLDVFAVVLSAEMRVGEMGYGEWSACRFSRTERALKMNRAPGERNFRLRAGSGVDGTPR
jgi:hypothetical protein